MDGIIKKPEKLLSTDDIRKKARDWTLAGDAGLLAYLEQFSEKICNTTHETHTKFSELIEGYEEVTKSIDNITNEFLSLQNCQFVENRVYDDETPTDENTFKKILGEEERERLLLLQYKEAVDIGLKLLDTHFQQVEVIPNSDSDEDEDFKTGNVSVIWKPRNQYGTKKFPLLIGSPEWWNDDKVGLGNKEENSDTENLISDSESDVDIESDKGRQIKQSPSSSFKIEAAYKINNFYTSTENLFSTEQNCSFDKNSSEAASFVNSGIIEKPDNILPKSDCPVNFTSEVNKYVEENTNHNGANVTQDVNNTSKINTRVRKRRKLFHLNNDFTRELAAKLDSFGKTDGVDFIKVNSAAPSETKYNVQVDGNNLFGEDDDNDLFSGNIKNLPVIGSNPLFDDPENNKKLFDGSNKLFSGNHLFNPDVFERTKAVSLSKDSLDKTVEESKKSMSKAEVMKDLFGDDNENDDSLFYKGPCKNKLTNKSSHSQEADIMKFVTPSKSKNIIRSKGLFDVDSEDDGTGEPSIFSGTDREDGDSTLSLSKNIKEPHLFSSHERDMSESSNTHLKIKPMIGLEQPFIPSEKESIAVLHDAVENNGFEVNQQKINNEKMHVLVEDLLEASMATPTSKIISEVEDEDDDMSLFIKKSKNVDALSVSSNHSSLFDEISTSKTNLASLFEKQRSNKFDDLFSPTESFLFGGSTLVKEDEGDLFHNNSSNTKQKDKQCDLFSVTSEEKPQNSLLLDEGAKFKEQEKSDLFSNKFKNYFEDEKKGSLFADVDNTGDLFGYSVNTEDNFTTATLFNKNSDNFQLPGLFSDGPENSQIRTKDKGGTNIDECANAPKKNELLPKIGFLETLEPKIDILFEKVPYSHRPEEVVSKASEAILPAGENEPFKEKNSSILKATYKGTNVDDAGDLFDENKREHSEFMIKPKPPNSLNIKKDLNSLEDCKIKSIGKLNIPENLKNKLESVVKPTSTSEYINQIEKKECINSVLEIKAEEEPEIKPFEPHTNLLKCPSRDRVKIPVRRRPQSRRARQEAIRNSTVDIINSESENERKPYLGINKSISQEKGNLKVPGRKESESKNNTPELFPKSHPLSPSTDEEDFFNVPGLDSNLEKEDHNFFKSNLFQGNSMDKDDNLLFDGGPVLSPHTLRKDGDFSVKANKLKNLFDSTGSVTKSKSTSSIFNFDENELSDDDDNLFKSIVPKTDNKGEKNISVMPKTKDETRKFNEEYEVKKSLFDVDLDGDDDLFCENFEESPSDKQRQAVTENVFNVKKEKNEVTAKTSRTFVDPLGLMSADGE